MSVERGHIIVLPSDPLTEGARKVLAEDDIDDIFGVKHNRVRSIRYVGKLGTCQHVSVAQRELRTADQANYDRTKNPLE
jgi:hypothetical protein